MPIHGPQCRLQSFPSLLDHRSKIERAEDATVASFDADEPLKLDAGILLSPFRLAYRTYGRLNAERSNAILVCHALTLDQYVADEHPITGKPGWWRCDGPDRTGRSTPNVSSSSASIVIGGCMGSTGPAEIDPAGSVIPTVVFSGHHRRRHGARPVAAARSPGDRKTILRDRRLDGRNAGAAMGSQLSASRDDGGPDAPRRRGTRHAEHRLPRSETPKRSWPIRTGADGNYQSGRHRAAQRSRRRAHGGAYHLSLGNRAAPQVRTQIAGSRAFGIPASTPISRSDPVARHQGLNFVERFDASLLSLYHPRDGLFRSRGGSRNGVRNPDAFRGTPARFCVVSFTSSWLFPTPEEPGRSCMPSTPHRPM